MEFKSPIDIQDSGKIRPDVLETFKYKGTKQLIQYTTKEFSAVCPGTGLPDIATVVIEYIPNKCCLELKSLKYYFVSFRSVGIYQEDMTNRIFNDIRRIIKPKYLSIKTIYSTRGGIDSVCSIKNGKTG